MKTDIAQIVTNLFDVDVDVVLTRPDPRFGDWATNIAMQLARPVGRAPREIAEELAVALRQNPHFEEVTIAGPGFINIRLSDTAVLAAIRSSELFVYEDQKIVFEYSCPNAFKELHTGHLYQTVFGDIVSRLLILGGAQLQRTSFGGDVGLHVAKCLWGMRDRLGGEYPEKLDTAIAADPFARSRWVSECYVRGARAYEEDQATKDDIDELNKTVYGFHHEDDHESPLARMYWTTRQWSFDYFDAFYALIDVEKLRYYPESQTAVTGMNVVKEQFDKGVLKKSDGAIVFEGDKEQHLHTRVFVTSKGLPTYETKDIGVIWQEKHDYDFEHRYLLTGNDQKEYMRVVFAAAETFRPSLAGTMTHLTNGTVKFADGKKMSSRLGNVTRALDVISIVREKVRELIDDESLVEDVTLGAIKYAFARYKLGGDIAFDVEETVSLQGNSGPYLQYAHARARRILEKSGSGDLPSKIHPEDRALLRKLGEYNEAIEQAVQNLEPHHICNYLFELAQEFNRYYEKNRVVGSEHERHRAGIVTAYADTLRRGLHLLGIHAPERM